MIKCPKCQFSQPLDTYCANCGVNMETYRPEPKPFLKSLLTHWLFHLALIIVLIVGLVVYDRSEPNPAPVASAQPQNEFKEDAAEIQPAAKAEPQPIARAEAPPEQYPAAGVKMGAGAINNDAAENAQPVARNKKNPIQVTFYSATRNAFSDLQRDAQSASFSGEASGGIIDKKKVAQLVSARELRLLSSDSFKDYDSQHPITVFKGQRSASSGKSVGIYFQLAPMKFDATSVQLEIRSWGNLKTQGNEEELFASEMTVNSQASGYIAGFLPKDKAFTDEEKLVFKSDRTLQIYTQESFWDGQSDLIMIVELTDVAG
jgi:hypothetical protein